MWVRTPAQLSWSSGPGSFVRLQSRSWLGLWSHLTGEAHSRLITRLLEGQSSGVLGRWPLHFFVTCIFQHYTANHNSAAEQMRGREGAARQKPASLTQAWRWSHSLFCKSLEALRTQRWSPQGTNTLQGALQGATWEAARSWTLPFEAWDGAS